jgi:hypothetical protein
LDVRRRVRRRHAHRHVVCDDDDFGFEVDAPVLAAGEDRIARAVETGTDGLVHKRIDVEAFRHFRAARAAHAFDVREVGAAIDEFVGARQRRGKRGHVERERAVGFAVVQCFRQCIQTRRRVVPVVQRRLQCRGDAARAHGARKIAADDDQRAVAAAFLETAKLHGLTPIALNSDAGATFDTIVRRWDFDDKLTCLSK